MRIEGVVEWRWEWRDPPSTIGEQQIEGDMREAQPLGRPQGVRPKLVAGRDDRRHQEIHQLGEPLISKAAAFLGAPPALGTLTPLIAEAC